MNAPASCLRRTRKSRDKDDEIKKPSDIGVRSAGARDPADVSLLSASLDMDRPCHKKDLAMRALRTHELGGPEHLVEEEAPVPTPGTGDALVRVHAASFTPTELGWTSTWVDRAGRDRRPVIPGHEVSGVVTALGYGTTGVAVGDAVYGLTDWYRDGAAAEYVAVEARNLARKPDRLDHRTAAVTPMVALTAQQALFDHGALARGQTVAVLGAGGGVGTFAVQLARAAGARVIALARVWASELLRELGADVYVDVELAPFRDVDLVLDFIGGEVLRRACVSIKPGAGVVSMVEPPPVEGGRRGWFFVVEPSRSQLVELGKRIATGELRPVIGTTWPLSQGRAAFEAKQRGRQPGKSVLVVSEER
jgi:NADPH:quinone reductase-like Zn-dependent oxidoreductase